VSPAIARFFVVYESGIILAVIKNAIAPIQAWLMSQGRCVGCGRELSEGKHETHRKGQKVTCKCDRIYIKNDKKYRRALLDEV